MLLQQEQSQVQRSWELTAPNNTKAVHEDQKSPAQQLQVGARLFRRTAWSSNFFKWKREDNSSDAENEIDTQVVTVRCYKQQDSVPCRV